MTKSVLVESISADLKKIRETKPVIHHITNFVTMDLLANGVLALGASPVMAHAKDEVEDMASIASSMVINIGTLDEEWTRSMRKAAKRANERNIPIVFDPVGSGATSYRTDFCREFSKEFKLAAIKGNASEVMSIIDDDVKTKGVDSGLEEESSLQRLKDLKRYFSANVVATGATDLVMGDAVTGTVANGHEMMGRVTGMGCLSASVVATFCAVNSNHAQAALHAMAVMGISGEIAAESSTGPGSFRTHFLDALYNLDAKDIEQFLRVEVQQH